jgi:hypothetical protein
LTAHTVLVGENTSAIVGVGPGTALQVLTSNGAADPSFQYVPLVIGFIIADGTAGTNIGPELAAPRTGQVTKCKIVTKTSDGSTALTLKIKQNGTDVFSVDPTVTAGTSGGTVSTFTTLTSSPLPVTIDDVFKIDITSGTSSWVFSVQLE